MNDLLKPLEVTEESAEQYVANIADRTTEQLHDDYQIIWLSQPPEGYGLIKHFITQIRLAIIDALRTRKPVGLRPSLQNRLAAADCNSATIASS